MTSILEHNGIEGNLGERVDVPTPFASLAALVRETCLNNDDPQIQELAGPDLRRERTAFWHWAGENFGVPPHAVDDLEPGAKRELTALLLGAYEHSLPPDSQEHGFVVALEAAIAAPNDSSTEESPAAVEAA